jgi:transketolase
MKQLIILFGIILFSITVYSQDTSDAICMPTDVAKQIAEDLIVGDSAKAMLVLTEEELSITKDKLSFKDSIILISKMKEINLNDQLRNEKKKTEAYTALYEDSKKQYATLAKEYKKYKVKKKITNVFYTAGLVVLVTLLISK